MKIYNGQKFLALEGKVPAYRGNWREQGRQYGEAKRRLSQGGNIGFIVPLDMIVIDVDPRNGGDESYEKLLDKLGAPDLATIYPTVITGANGLHIYARIKGSSDAIASHNPDYPGIDVKKYGGYVVAAGSKHPETGKAYEIYHDPDKALEIIPAFYPIYNRAIPRRVENIAAQITPGQLNWLLERLDVCDFEDHDTWFQIMCAAHNSTGGDGLEEFLNWCLADPKYANDETVIRQRWYSLKGSPTPATIGSIIQHLDPAVADEWRTRQIEQLLDEIPAETKRLKSKVLPSAVALELESADAYDPENDLPHRIATAVLARHELMSGSDSRFWEFTNTHWRPIGHNLVTRYVYLAYSRMKPSKSVSTIISATVGVLTAMTAQDHTPGALPIEGHSIINVQNGEIWIDDVTGEVDLYPHDSRSNQIFCLPLYYDPKAKAPRFKRFLAEIFPIDTRDLVIDHLLEILGYTIQTRKNIATWVLFHGRGANGKTVLLSVLSAILGEAALERPIGSISTERNNHALASLPGKLALIDDDVSFNTVLPDGELKSLSENKWLEANPKNATPFRFKSTVIPILSANSYPSTKDLSDGLRRRAQVFPFSRVFSPDMQDTSLTDYLIKNELPGILNLFLAGLLRLRRRGRFNPPAVCLTARDQWYGANNAIVNYKLCNLAKCPPELSPILFSDVWANYLDWCVDEGLRRPLSRQQFQYALESVGVTVLRNRTLRVMGYRIKKKKI